MNGRARRRTGFIVCIFGVCGWLWDAALLTIGLLGHRASPMTDDHNAAARAGITILALSAALALAFWFTIIKPTMLGTDPSPEEIVIAALAVIQLVPLAPIAIIVSGMGPVPH